MRDVSSSQADIPQSADELRWTPGLFLCVQRILSKRGGSGVKAPTACVDQYHEEVKVQEGKIKWLGTNPVWTRRSILTKTKTLKAVKTCCLQIS